jgi:hypothetical protein
LIVDNSLLPDVYKIESKNDITFDYFKDYNDIYIPNTFNEYIDFNEGYENIKFSQLNYEKISPFVQKYFSPSTKILSKIKMLEVKYNIDYNNICFLEVMIKEEKLNYQNIVIILKSLIKLLKKTPISLF